jgi:hypothetical protein
MKIKSDSAIPFLDILVSRKGTTLTNNIYRKPIHTGRNLNFISNHPTDVKRGLLQNLHNLAPAICQERQGLFNEFGSLRRDLQVSGHPQRFIDSVINSKGSSCPDKQVKSLGSAYIPYTKSIPENLNV